MTLPWLLACDMAQPFFFFFFSVLGLELRDFTFSHSLSPIFVMDFFRDRVLRTVCPGWLQTRSS
jgi:hypothetical protein